jgi:anti-sigma factor RsiW
MTNVDVEQLSCQELVELVTAYLEGALDERDHERFEEHLAACGNCQLYLAQMRTTIELVGGLTPADLSPDAERELLTAFRDWKRD